MTFITALILGIVEGITEFLPISSTAHMEIAARLMSLQQTDFLKTFEIVIQFGAILAVVVLYFSILKKNIEVWKRIIAAFIPTGIIGFILYKVIKKYFLGNFTLMIIMLAVGGIAIIIFEYMYSDDTSMNSMEEIERMPYLTAILIGLAQAIAVVPGVSRSAATIIAGRVLGVSKKAIVEFSFLLAIPTMAAASGYDLLKNAHGLSQGDFLYILIGLVAAFISALLTAKWLLNYIKRHSFSSFGYYRLILAIVLAFFFIKL